MNWTLVITLVLFWGKLIQCQKSEKIVGTKDLVQSPQESGPKWIHEHGRQVYVEPLGAMV